MIALLKWILARVALFKLLLKSFGALAWLLPIALLLKALGWPVLLLLGVLAIPLIVVLMVIGLPIFLVVAAAGVMLMIVFWIVSTGILLLKIAVPILLVFWLVRWLSRKGRGRRGGEPGKGGSSGAGGATSEPPVTGPVSDMPESGLA